MRTTTVFVGWLFGVILGVAAAAPLYASVPARYVNNWHYMTHEGALLGLGIALVVPAVAGFLAAALQPEEPIRNGGGAGLLAAVIGAAGMALPSSVVMGCGSLLELVSSGRINAERLGQAIGDAALSSATLSAAVGLSVLIGAAGLGAIGGVVFDLWRGNPSRPGQDVRRSVVPLVVSWTAPLALGGVWASMAGAARTREALQLEGGWVVTLQLTAPDLVAGLLQAVWLAWATRDAVLSYRKGRRMAAALWMVAALGVPAVLVVERLVLFPTGLLSPWPWLACVGVLGAALLAPIVAARSDGVLDTEPAGFGAVIGDGLAIGALTVGQALLVGGSWAVGQWQLVQPYVDALIGGAATVGTTPEAQVARLFWLHWGAVGAAGVLSFAWLVVGVPLWLVGRATGGRRD